MPATLIDTVALWKIVVIGLIGGVGVVAAMSILVANLTRRRQAQDRDTGGHMTVAAANLTILACGAFCVAAVVLGLYAMTQKS
jgi:hypothetical protein